MRLTLRTLLAYLDDTLSPEQVKVIGQKVAESDTAQELITRIKQVTRRRRLTTPSGAGPGGKLDINTIAEYLDNCLSEDQVAEVEQLCLSSDVHLAEIAACHQILTLVLGEPVLIPPASQQRMYKLVKGPESIPFRKPLATETPEDEPADEGIPDDDVIRPLGLPVLHRRINPMTQFYLIGGALAACLLLIVSVVLALHAPGADFLEDGTRPKVALLPPGKGPQVPVEEPPKPPVQTEKPPVKTDTEPKKTETVTSNGEKPKPDPIRNPMPMPEPGLQEVPVAPPQTARREEGRYEAGVAGPSVLVQFQPENGQWRRLDSRQPEVYTGSPVVSLPGFRSVVQLKKSLRLQLWGMLREQFFFPPVQESVVELHAHDQLEADLTLRRGRITLTSLKTTPVRVRLRFDNPTNPNLKNVWDLTFETLGTEVLMDLWSAFSPGEPFYRQPDHPNRIGPQAMMHLIVLRGRLTLRHDNQTVSLQEPPGTALRVWSSFSETRTGELPSVPDWATPNPKPPPNMPAEAEKRFLDLRDKMLAARDSFGTSLSGKNDKIDVTLPLLLKSDNPFERTLAVRSFGAINDLPSLVDALADPERRDVRQAAMDTLRRWVACERDNDYKLFAELQQKYKKAEAEDIMTLLHSFSAAQIAEKETYEALVDNLDNPRIAIRELAAWHLYALAPVGASIRYSPEADQGIRLLAQREWRKLITDGKVPQKQAPK